MEFTKKVFHSAAELHEYLSQLHKNIAHVKSMRVNIDSAAIEIDLDWKANASRASDYSIPLLRPRLSEAKQLVAELYSHMQQHQAPTYGSSQSLFDMIDPWA